MKHPYREPRQADRIYAAESTGYMPLVDGEEGTLIRTSRDRMECKNALLMYKDRDLRTRIVMYVRVTPPGET
jgi:hypothetical protein